MLGATGGEWPKQKQASVLRRTFSARDKDCGKDRCTSTCGKSVCMDRVSDSRDSNSYTELGNRKVNTEGENKDSWSGAESCVCVCVATGG